MHFVVTVGEKQERELRLKLQFLFSMKVFSRWSYNLLKQLYLNSEPLKDCYLNQNVFTEGAHGSSVFIIKTGLFKVLKMVDFDEIYDGTGPLAEVYTRCTKPPMMIAKAKTKIKPFEVKPWPPP